MIKPIFSILLLAIVLSSSVDATHSRARAPFPRHRIPFNSPFSSTSAPCNPCSSSTATTASAATSSSQPSVAPGQLPLAAVQTSSVVQTLIQPVAAAQQQPQSQGVLSNAHEQPPSSEQPPATTESSSSCPDESSAAPSSQSTEQPKVAPLRPLLQHQFTFVKQRSFSKEGRVQKENQLLASATGGLLLQKRLQRLKRSVPVGPWTVKLRQALISLGASLDLLVNQLTPQDAPQNETETVAQNTVEELVAA